MSSTATTSTQNTNAPTSHYLLDEEIETMFNEPYVPLGSCNEVAEDKSGWWNANNSGGNGTSSNTSGLKSDHGFLQPVQKRPVGMGYSHNEMHMIRTDDPKFFDRVMQDYTVNMGNDLESTEMDYLQSVFTQDGFSLDLNTPLYQPNKSHGSRATPLSSSKYHSSHDDGNSSDTTTSSSINGSTDLAPMSLPIKSESVTFVSASGKVKMICEVQDCTKVAQSRKRCKRHGGGPRCRYPGCTKSSQGKGRCRSHGGGRKCSVPDCNSGAQQRGLCSRHGGAKLCSFEGCQRHSRGNGLCAHHGGGKRCSVVDCNRSSRIQGMCALHKRMAANGMQLQHKKH